MADQFVQTASASGTTSCTAVLTGVTAGNTIVAFLWDGNSSSPTTHTVNDGTAYTAGATAVDSGDFVWGQVFTLQNAGAGTHNIVGTVDSGNGVELYVVEVTAPTTGAVQDTKGQFQNSPGTGTDSVTSGLLAITSAATVVTMSTASNVVNAGDIPNVGTGFTSRNSGTSGSIGSWRLATGGFSSNNGGTFTAPVGTDLFVTLAAAITNSGVAADTLMGQACL